MARVAFIGLGRMGHGMAGRYLDAGFEVAVWNRSKAKAEDLIARGARWASSPADAADGADAIVTMVADDEASRTVWLGKDGAASAAKSRHARDRMFDRVASACARSLARTARTRSGLYRLSGHRPAGRGCERETDPAGRRRARRSRTRAAVSRAALLHDPAFRRGRQRHGLQADQQSDGRDPDRRHRRGPCDRRAGRPRHEAGAGGDRDRRRRQSAGDTTLQADGGTRFRRCDLHRGAAPQGCGLRGGAGREPVVRHAFDGPRGGRGLCTRESPCAGRRRRQK